MNQRQNEIATQAVADIVREAMSDREKPSAEELKTLAVDAAKAISAAFAVFDSAI